MPGAQLPLHLKPPYKARGACRCGRGIGGRNNHPNPTSRASTITISTPRPGPLDLTLVDALGNERLHLASGPIKAGEHIYRTEISQFENGVYFWVARMDEEVAEASVVVEH